MRLTPELLASRLKHLNLECQELYTDDRVFLRKWTVSELDSYLTRRNFAIILYVLALSLSLSLLPHTNILSSHVPQYLIGWRAPKRLIKLHFIHRFERPPKRTWTYSYHVQTNVSLGETMNIINQKENIFNEKNYSSIFLSLVCVYLYFIHFLRGLAWLVRTARSCAMLLDSNKQKQYFCR